MSTVAGTWTRSERGCWHCTPCLNLWHIYPFNLPFNSSFHELLIDFPVVRGFFLLCHWFLQYENLGISSLVYQDGFLKFRWFLFHHHYIKCQGFLNKSCNPGHHSFLFHPTIMDYPQGCRNSCLPTVPFEYLVKLGNQRILRLDQTESVCMQLQVSYRALAWCVRQDLPMGSRQQWQLVPEFSCFRDLVLSFPFCKSQQLVL